MLRPLHPLHCAPAPLSQGEEAAPGAARQVLLFLGSPRVANLDEMESHK